MNFLKDILVGIIAVIGTIISAIFAILFLSICYVFAKLISNIHWILIIAALVYIYLHYGNQT